MNNDKEEVLKNKSEDKEESNSNNSDIIVEIKDFKDFKTYLKKTDLIIQDIDEVTLTINYKIDKNNQFFLKIIDANDFNSFLKISEGLDSAKKELNEQLLRLAAEFDNYKKRSIKDGENLKNRAIEQLFNDVVFFVDNFERGLKIYEESNKDTDFYKGMKAVMKDFEKFIEKNNIKKIEILPGDNFDPNFHQAIELRESKEFESNKVIEIIQPGYSLNDKLLRPVMVVVSSGEKSE